MTDRERIAGLIKGVRALDMGNFATWEAIHWLEVAERMAELYEEGLSEEAHALLNEACDYSRRFEARYID